MNGYTLPSADALAIVLATIVVPVAAALAFRAARPASWMRLVGWLLVLLAPTAVAIALEDAAGGTRMLALCAATFSAMKALVLAEARLAGRPTPTVLQYLAFHLFWPGMRPWAFTSLGDPARPRALRMVLEGATIAVLGVAIILGARALAQAGTSRTLAVALLGLGLLLTFHFGAFRALAGLWRRVGAGVLPLMDAPWRARSLGEFWGRRWNLAFSEMVQTAVERPISRRFGSGAGTFAAFLGSGLLHELAISLPARGGYGRPLAYFALQGALVLAEVRWLDRARGSRAHRLLTLAAVILPAPILFHAPFVESCLAPLLASR